MYVMRVSAGSTPQSIANSIRGAIFDSNQMPTIRAIGAGAVAQACKGIAIGRSHVAIRGLDLGCAIGFESIRADDGSRLSAMTFRLFLR